MAPSRAGQQSCLVLTHHRDFPALCLSTQCLQGWFLSHSHPPDNARTVFLVSCDVGDSKRQATLLRNMYGRALHELYDCGVWSRAAADCGRSGAPQSVWGSACCCDQVTECHFLLIWGRWLTMALSPAQGTWNACWALGRGTLAPSVGFPLSLPTLLSDCIPSASVPSPGEGESTRGSPAHARHLPGRRQCLHYWL